ncbi:hypothetical protein JI750_03355 [Flavobacterium sp. GN10]|uniref:Uncharacterized protein n=1 Tax=Flavobacterium tagetis TaxID=2801336 RepID=A0ABS1K9A7_9FLAO|nr:hypothetical protein [Flavobacterium tagetis]MBL0735908.1 hypothetical protein [Flavobacterium tagetis]
MITLICLIGVSILTIVVAVFDFKEKQKESKEALENEIKRSKETQEQLNKSNSIIEENKKIMESQQKVFTNTMTVIELQNELNKKNTEIHELQKNVLNNLIGNKNLPLIVIGKGKSLKTDETIDYYLFSFQITNRGNTPIRGAKAFIWDQYHSCLNESVTYENSNNDSFTCLTKPYADTEGANRNISIGNLPAQNGYTEFYKTELPQKIKNFRYHVKIEWDNGWVYFGIKGSNDILDKNNIPISTIEGYQDYLGNTENKCVSLIP